MLADLIRDEMRKREMSQTELAERLGVGQSIVSRWLGKNPPRPSPEHCDRIAAWLGMDPAEVTRLAHGLSNRIVEQAKDPERSAMLAEVDDIFMSFERGKWRDLIRTLKSMQSLASPHGSENTTPHGYAPATNHARVA